MVQDFMLRSCACDVVVSGEVTCGLEVFIDTGLTYEVGFVTHRLRALSLKYTRYHLV